MIVVGGGERYLGVDADSGEAPQLVAAGHGEDREVREAGQE